jgi:hypothetical protein
VTKQQILDECARRIGDDNAQFKATVLSKAFDFVLLELSQLDCLSLLRKQSSKVFSDPAGAIANGLLNINLATLLGVQPERVLGDIIVPAWQSYEGRIIRLEDKMFESNWLNSDPSYRNKPRYWRLYPSQLQLQLWPAPDSPDNAATYLIEWTAPPTTLADNDTIAEVLLSDMPTILAGLYRYGILFQDETIRDEKTAEFRWQQGVHEMRARAERALRNGRMRQISYREF